MTQERRSTRSASLAAESGVPSAATCIPAPLTPFQECCCLGAMLMFREGDRVWGRC